MHKQEFQIQIPYKFQLTATAANRISYVGWAWHACSVVSEFKLLGMKRAREGTGSPQGKGPSDRQQVHTPLSPSSAQPQLQASQQKSASRKVLDVKVQQAAAGHSSGSSADHHALPQAQPHAETRHPDVSQDVPPQAQACCPTESTSPDQPQQIHFQRVLDLDSLTAPPKRMQLLAGHLPFPAHYQTWCEQQHNPIVCSIRLIGDASQPHEYVGVGVQEMVTHSPWAAARLRQTEMQTSGLETIVPICTPPAVVQKMVEALYTGYIELQHDVEHMLVLANCLQVKLVEDTCIRYLLQLKLPAEQIRQIMRLYDTLTLLDPRKQLLKKYAHTAWVEGALDILPALLNALVHAGPEEIELCKEVLFSEECGALCELQVYDMLCAAGLTQSDPVLATLFRVERLCDAAMELFTQVVNLDPVTGASRELLSGIVARGRWRDLSTAPHQQSQSRRREKIMLQQLNLTTGTQFKLSPTDPTLMSVGPLTGGSSHLNINSLAKMYTFGKNVDQLVTYAVYNRADGPLLGVLDVFPISQRCDHIVCGEDSKSVAFVRHLHKNYQDVVNETNRWPLFGIWMYKKEVPPPAPQPVDEPIEVD